jgi:hypothetical protein
MGFNCAHMQPLRAAPTADAPFSFCRCAEFGGLGTDEWNAELFGLMARLRPDLFLAVGDVVSQGERYADWERYFFGPGKDFLARTPFLLVPGNHESLHDTDGSERLWSGGSYFSSFVAQQPAPGNWFGLRYGNCAFIGLDSTAIATHGGNGAALREGWGPASPHVVSSTKI